MRTVLHLGLSYACNLKCSHCFVKKADDEFDAGLWSSFIRFLVERHGLFLVYYTYGEPFLSHNLFQMQEICRQLGLVQIVMSNGTLISASDIAALKQNEISMVYISIDHAIAKKHDLNRGVKGAYSKAVASVKQLVESGIRTGIATTVNSENQNEIYAIAHLANKLRVSSLSLLRQRGPTGMVNLDKENEYYSFFADYIRAPWKFNLFVHDMYLNPIVEDAFRTGKISTLDNEKWIEMNACHASTTISVAPNGDVFSCNLFGTSALNIREYPFDVIMKRLEEYDDSFACCAELSGTC